MRTISIVAVTAGLALIAGCGEGSAFDNGFRTNYRAEAIEGCLAGARANLPAGVQIDVQRVCNCAVDRHMEGKSATELMRDDDQAGAQRTTEQCLREMMGQAAAPAGAGGAKPNP